MKAWFFCLCAGVIGSALALQFPSTAIAKGKETVLYSFGGFEDPASPEAGPIDVQGTLYGTTYAGGTDTQASYGAVYALDPKTGADTVLYSFCNQQDCPDGARPTSSLIDVKGTLYGTTFYGGVGGLSTCGTGYYGCGVAFSLDPATGTEKTLYSFCSLQNCADGSVPPGGMIDVDGTLYGTTKYGGAGGNAGTVFALDPGTGAETVLYSFCSRKNCMDGSQPYAGLIAVNGTLYGTTESGGAGSGGGTVFAIDPDTGAETVLYSFCSRKNCMDGASPEAALIDVNGTLYGTTESGGAHESGTVFSLDANSGTETVLYSFCSKLRNKFCEDGAYPRAALLDVNGTLYGTAKFGGTFNMGTIFALDPGTGTETVLHSFSGSPDGESPEAGLIDVKGTLYGTTFNGGTSFDDGTMFKLKP